MSIFNGKVRYFANKEYVESGDFWYAMKIEQLSSNVVRFYCNDSENETDFDDLIFDLEIID